MRFLIGMMRLCLLLGVGVLLFGRVALASFHDRFVVYFPQVVRGVLVDYYETIIVISNPSLDSVDVAISTSGLIPQVTLAIGPGQTEQVRISGTDFKMGFVRLEASHTIAAAGHIVTRPSLSSSLITSEVTLPGQPPTSFAVVPIHRKATGAPSAKLADNTAVAINPATFAGPIHLILRDSSGATIRDRVIFQIGHYVRFIDEIFPDLPGSFETGSLTIEDKDPGLIPQAFAATALYFEGARMRAAPVTAIDIPRLWSVKLKSTDSGQQTVREIEAQYGFRIVSFSIGDPSIAHVLGSVEVMRAVARDPRIQYVLPSRNLGGPV